jgi:hypothetical protein
MARMNIHQYVTYLYGIGKNLRDVYKSIKKHPTLKYATNKIIGGAIDAFLRAKEAAQKLEGYKKDTKIGRSKYDGYNTPHEKICIEYSFTYDGGVGKERGSNIRGGGNFITEVDKDATKEDAMNAIKEQIRDWIDTHYDGKNARKATNTINLITIRAC